MNKILIKIRTSKPYRTIRQQMYYMFQYKKRNQKIADIINGINNEYSYLRKFKDVHVGERCFIVATGPSLTQEELNLIRNEYTIGVNALCMKFKEMNWRTSYFVISDYAAYVKMRPYLKESGMNFFCAYKSDNDDESCIFLPTDIHNSYMIDYDRKEFTNNIEQGCGNGNTVVLQAIQIAVYMGFKQIYLLGVDCNYDQKNGKLYFVDHGIRGWEQKDAGIRMIADFSVLNRYVKEWGVEIYNASNGGMLEVFPRVNLKDVINEKE